MFGAKHHDIVIDEKQISTINGNTYVRSFHMKDVYNDDNNTLYIISFPRHEAVIELADKIEFYGVPGRDIDFYADHYTYVGLKKTKLFHTNFFDRDFTNLVRHSSNEMVQNALEKYGYDMRSLVTAHLFGGLESFGYDNDNRCWRRVDEISKQASIGEIATFRTYKVKHAGMILTKLNKLFPDGKRVQRFEKSQ